MAPLDAFGHAYKLLNSACGVGAFVGSHLGETDLAGNCDFFQ